MDSVPRLPQTSASAAVHAPGQDQPGDTGEDPYSSGLQALPNLLGGLIALATLTLPLATVLVDRSQVPLTPLSYGSAPAAGLPSARTGEHRGGDPGRQPQ